MGRAGAGVGTCPTCGQQATAEQFRIADDIQHLEYLEQRDRARAAAAERGEPDIWAMEYLLEQVATDKAEWLAAVSAATFTASAALDVARALLPWDGLTVAALAARTGFTQEDVHRAVAELAAGGWVTVEAASPERGLHGDRVRVTNPSCR